MAIVPKHSPDAGDPHDRGVAEAVVRSESTKTVKALARAAPPVVAGLRLHGSRRRGSPFGQRTAVPPPDGGSRAPSVADAG
jgi:hypothetical protein